MISNKFKTYCMCTYGISTRHLFCQVVLSHFTLLSTSHLLFSKLTSSYGKFARCTLLKCYNACCTLLGGKFNIDKLPVLNCTLPNLQLHIVKSPFSHLHFYIQLHPAKFTTSHCRITIFTAPLLHCKLDKSTLFYGLPKFFGLPPKKSIGCPIFLKVFFCLNFVFLGCFLLGWVGGLH
jgi:hypothetical protein